MPRTRSMLTAVVAVLAAALLLPFLVNVNRYRLQIVRELQVRLGRAVQVGSVRLELLSGPGFELNNVAIADDPAFGNEPALRAPVLRATLRLRSLWTGRLSFSSLVFVDPSVNLARNSEGHWNLEPLLAGAGTMAHPGRPPLPYIELQDARINFKSGDTKSVFFLSGADVALFAADAGRIGVRLSASPSRTDRVLTDIGTLQVEGSFPAGASAPGDGVRLQVAVSDAYLADLLMLALGRDPGVHGIVNFQASLDGELRALRAAGSLRVSDLHRWDLLPPRGDPSLELQFASLLEMPAGLLRLQKLHVALGAGVLEGTGTIAHVLTAPEAQIRVNFSGARASSVVAAAHHFAPGLSSSLRVEGMLDGELQFKGPPVRVEGTLTGRDLEVADTAVPAMKAAEVRATLSETSVSLEPAVMELADGRRLALSAAWDWAAGSGKLSAAGRDLPVRTLSSAFELAGLDPAWFGGALPEARVSLNVQAELSRGNPPRLTGWGQLARARWTPPGLASPVLLHAARLDFTGDQLRASRIVASWAGATITGSLRVPLRNPAFLLADLHADELSSAALASAIRVSRQGALPLIFTRETGPGNEAGRPASPGRDKPRLHVDGRFVVDRLRLRRVQLEAVQGSFQWSARQLRLDPAEARFAGGALRGKARVDFSAAAPAFEINARVRGLAVEKLAALLPEFDGLAAGTADGSLQLAVSGWEIGDLLDTLSMRMRLEGRDLVLRNVDLETAAGRQPAAAEAGGQRAGAAAASRVSAFTADLAVDQRQVRLRKVLLHTPSAVFQASGTVGFDRAADIQVLPVQGPSAGRVPLNAFRLVGPLEAPRARLLEEIRKTSGGTM